MLSDTKGAEVIRGSVLRCTLTRLNANEIRYRGAIAFESDVPSLADDGPWVCDSEIGDEDVEVIVWPHATACAPAD